MGLIIGFILGMAVTIYFNAKVMNVANKIKKQYFED
jgi:hypothetical protein